MDFEKVYYTAVAWPTCDEFHNEGSHARHESRNQKVYRHFMNQVTTKRAASRSVQAAGMNSAEPFFPRPTALMQDVLKTGPGSICVSGFATSVVDCDTARVPMGLPM